MLYSLLCSARRDTIEHCSAEKCIAIFVSLKQSLSKARKALVLHANVINITTIRSEQIHTHKHSHMRCVHSRKLSPREQILLAMLQHWQTLSPKKVRRCLCVQENVSERERERNWTHTEMWKTKQMIRENFPSGIRAVFFTSHHRLFSISYRRAAHWVSVPLHQHHIWMEKNILGTVFIWIGVVCIFDSSRFN